VLDEVSHLEANGILTGEESLLVMIVSSPKCRSGILKGLLERFLGYLWASKGNSPHDESILVL
jgi:hypothetical protein